MEICDHFNEIDQSIEVVSPETAEGCFECLKINGKWLHLRQCMTCGLVHCCDSSPNQHATKHYHATKHPVVKIVEQPYLWCYIDEMAVEVHSD